VAPGCLKHLLKETGTQIFAFEKTDEWLLTKVIFWPIRNFI
jgi:hypothetical protein